MKKIIIGLFLGSIVWGSVANAVPAFARKHQAECTQCHSAWPSLNAVGRAYKENGYRMSRSETSDFLNGNNSIPVTAVLKARPYEKSDSGEKKLRVLHEAELIVAGVMAKDFSGFFELEAEDDHGAGFEVQLPVAVIGWHPSQAANVQMSWGPISWSDPYDVYTNMRKMTRNRASIINERFDGADDNGRLRGSRQNLTVYGRPIENIFYSVGISGMQSDPVAEDGDIVSGRLAVDVTPDIMVGAMVMSGTCTNANGFIGSCAVDRDFTRTGIDVQADIGAIRVSGAYLQAKGDNAAATNEDENTSAFVEARYIISENNQPKWMPLIRVDSYERNDGADSYDEVTLHLSHYFDQNVRGFVEYIDQGKPVAANDDSTFTAQLELSF